MDHESFITKAKELVAKYTNDHLDPSDNHPGITPDDVFIPWSAKVLQNSKALLSTPLPDGMYYEVTLNGDRDEIYFDAYKKFENQKVEV